MNTDSNVHLGVLALQNGLIGCRQFSDACADWANRKGTSLLEVLIERGAINENDRVHLEYFLHRQSQIAKRDAQAGRAAMPADMKRLSDVLADSANDQYLTDFPSQDSNPADETIVGSPHAEERYKLIQLLATGGIGRVWVAHDRVLGRVVALKDLRPEFSADESACARFLQEARLTGQLEHPGIVPIYELSLRPGNREPFYTMRLVSGRTLAKAAKDFHDSRTAERTTIYDLLPLLQAFVTVCKTIAFAHSQGIIHRDLKGQNVMLGDFGEVVVLDWGLGKRIFAGKSGVASKTDRDHTDGDHTDHDYIDNSDSHLTVHGQTLGTPSHMSPEQAAGKLDEIDHLTDVYGLGALLYEILTGQPPIKGSDTKDLLSKIQQEEPIPPMEIWSAIPTPLNSACLRSLAKQRCERFASANELCHVVEEWQENDRKRAHEALAASESLYHALVETIPMNVWRKDIEGRFTFANKGFCEASGRSLEQILGKTDFDLFPHDSAEKYRQNDIEVVSTGQAIELTEEHETAAGDKMFVRVSKAPIRDANGKTVGTQGIFWDITDRQRLEATIAQTTEELVLARQQLAELNNKGR